MPRECLIHNIISLSRGAMEYGAVHGAAHGPGHEFERFPGGGHPNQEDYQRYPIPPANAPNQWDHRRPWSVSYYYQYKLCCVYWKLSDMNVVYYEGPVKAIIAKGNAQENR